jgi:hypothetical protein
MELQSVQDKMAVELNIELAPPTPAGQKYRGAWPWEPTNATWTIGQARISSFLCPSAGPYRNTLATIFALEHYNTIRGSAFPLASGGLNVGRTNYVAVSGYRGDSPPDVNAGWGPYKGLYSGRSKYRFSDIVDGTSNVFAFGEIEGGCNSSPCDNLQVAHSWMGSGALVSGFGLDPFYFPNDRWKYYWGQFTSKHPGVVQFALADGSIHNVSKEIDFTTYVYISAMLDGNTANMTSVF